MHVTYNIFVGDESNFRRIPITLEIDNPEIELDSGFLSSFIIVDIFKLPNIKRDFNYHENSLKEYVNSPPNILSKSHLSKKNWNNGQDEKLKKLDLHNYKLMKN